MSCFGVYIKAGKQLITYSSSTSLSKNMLHFIHIDLETHIHGDVTNEKRLKMTTAALQQ